MSGINNSFSNEVKSFVENNKVLSLATLGLAVLTYSIGNLAGRALSWIRESNGATKKTEAISREIFSSIKKTDSAKPRSSETLPNLDHAKLTIKPIIDELPNIFKSSQESPPVLLNRSSLHQLRAEYDALKTKDLKESAYIIPERRVCGFGGMESAYIIQKAINAVFVTNEEITKIHSMKFLPNSPFVIEDTPDLKSLLEEIKDESEWASILASTKKQAQAIAVTEGNKHVILQQAVKSCVPTCMAMLLLDHGKKANYEAVKWTYLANTEKAIQWAKEAQLACQVTEIPQKDAIEILSKCLAEKGPGMLSIDHPTIGGHVVILDEISIEKNEAIIRDPFHGWMISINLDSLKTWLKRGEEFLQIAGPLQGPG